jgi:hypothetical protein
MWAARRGGVNMSGGQIQRVSPRSSGGSESASQRAMGDSEDSSLGGLKGPVGADIELARMVQ